MDKSLLKKLGNISQIAGIRRCRLTSGISQDTEIAEIYNAAGLRATVVLDKCMDLYDFSYKSINISFLSKNSLVSNKFFTPLGSEFFTNWSAGMLCTCGLANAGDSCEDDDAHPIHGRINATPANNISICSYWEDNDYKLFISGDISETRLYGRNLTLHREISTSLYSKEIKIRDTVTNTSAFTEGVMLLYHFNFGYPLLDGGARFVSSSTDLSIRTGRDTNNKVMGMPEDDCLQNVFVHKPKTKRVYAGIINPALELGACLSFDSEALPVMLQWKNLRSHDYVAAIEPCNCMGLGRVQEQKNGTLPKIPPYSSISFEVTLRVLDGHREIDNFEKQCTAKKEV